MISGAHVVVYSKNAEADRAFFRDILGLPVGGCGSWLADLRSAADRSRTHPSEDDVHELYFMCDMHVEQKVKARLKPDALMTSRDYSDCFQNVHEMPTLAL
jgi:catechol 2,3-dioxygenase-like lactoylglutathione lyase family enzyme